MLPDKETRELIYGLAAVVAIIAFFIYNFTQIKLKRQNMSWASKYICSKISGEGASGSKFRFLKNGTLFVIIETIICTVFAYLPASLNFAFGNLTGTGANYFALLYSFPIFMMVMGFALWLNPLKQADISVPGIPLALVFTKIACFTSGCCNGLWWPGGPYNYSNRREEIPIQLVEAGVALALFIFLLWYKKRAKTGTVFPVYIILYSAIRFVTEFWRGELLVVGPFRLYHFFCLIGIMIGVAEYILVKKYGDKISLYFDNTFYFSRKRKEKLFKKVR